jgi:signal transduction histidine kinase
LPGPAVTPELPADLSGWDRLRRPVWLFDPETCRGLYANAAAVALWGAESREELLGRDFSELSPAVRTRMQRLALATADGDAVTERWSFYPGGQPVTVKAVISSFALADGRTVLLFEAASIDVEPEELRAVEALRHSANLISLFDERGRSTFANPAAFAAYGDDAAGFAGRFEDADRAAEAMARVLAGEALDELRQVSTEDGERWRHLDARRVVDPVTGAASVLLTERDVTAQVEAERALLAADERAEVAMAKQRFLANISHELRTPLNSVVGFAGLLGAGDLDKTQVRHLAHIVEAGETLTRIVNNVIDLAELDGGETRLEPAPFDPRALLDGALAAHGPAAAAKGLSLGLELCAGAPDGLVGDAGQIRKVLDHYLANAIKFTEHGEVTLRLDAGDADDATTLTVSVSDTGPGLDPATQGRLFRRFSQADDSLRKSVGGGGLGLAICRELIALMGGEVGVESRPGRGSRFWFRLTLPRVAESEAGANDAGEDARPLNVLYADDNEANRMLVQAILQSQGHRCELVCDGAEAVRSMAAGCYDLVLMDIQMPVQDGVSAAREIRTLPDPNGAVPILALTANTLSDQRRAYLDAGMQDCIAKPVNMAELLAKTHEWAGVLRAPAARSRTRG